MECYGMLWILQDWRFGWHVVPADPDRAPGPSCSLASSRLGYLGWPTNGRVLLALPPQTPMGAASGAKELSGSGFQMREVRTGHGKIIKNQQVRHQFVLGRPWRNTQALCRFHIIYSLADSFAAVQLPRKADCALAQS